MDPALLQDSANSPSASQRSSPMLPGSPRSPSSPLAQGHRRPRSLSQSTVGHGRSTSPIISPPFQSRRARAGSQPPRFLTKSPTASQSMSNLQRATTTRGRKRSLTTGSSVAPAFLKNGTLDEQYDALTMPSDELLIESGGGSGTSTRTGSPMSPSVNNSNNSNGNGGVSSSLPDYSNLIINYVPQDITEDNLRALFSPFGVIEHCKLVMDKHTGNSQGYGFVKFSTAEEASKAISMMNGLHVSNKRLKVSVARPSSSDIRGANVYVANLPLSITDRELEGVFGPYGELVETKILRDEMGESRGVGFVRFSLRSSAEAAIHNLNGVLLPNATQGLTVKLANASEKRVRGTLPQQQHHQQQQQQIPQQQLQLQPQLQQPALPAGMQPHPHALHHQQQQQPAYIHPGHQAGQGGMQMGHVTQQHAYVQGAYGQPHEAALMMAPPMAAYIPAQPAQPALVAGVAGPAMHPVMMMPQQPNAAVYAGGYAGPHPPTAPTTPYCIFVYNLPQDASEMLLYQLFGPYGAIASVKIIRDLQTGMCKGFGFVNMVRQSDAQTAINSLNGIKLGNKTLQVSFKTDKGSRDKQQQQRS